MKPAAAFFSFLINVIGALPVWFRSGVGRVLGTIYWCFPTPEKEIARHQLDLHVPEEGGSRHLRRVFAHFGQTALESLNVNAMVRNPDRHIDCKSRDIFDRVRRSDQPTVLLTAHTANWDLLGAYIVKFGIQLFTVGTPLKNPAWHDALNAMREKYGAKTLWRTGVGGTREIVRAFKGSGMIGALNDQDTRVKSLQVPFFGKPARTPVGLVTLGKRYGARFVWMFMFRTGFNRYTVWAGEFDPHLSAEEIVTAYNKELEAHIRRFPEQWVWFHKRWARRPNLPTLRTRDYVRYLEDELKKKRGAD